jgi:hypothetical protein
LNLSNVLSLLEVFLILSQALQVDYPFDYEQPIDPAPKPLPYSWKCFYYFY